MNDDADQCAAADDLMDWAHENAAALLAADRAAAASKAQEQGA